MDSFSGTIECQLKLTKVRNVEIQGVRCYSSQYFITVPKVQNRAVGTVWTGEKTWLRIRTKLFRWVRGNFMRVPVEIPDCLPSLPVLATLQVENKTRELSPPSC